MRDDTWTAKSGWDALTPAVQARAAEPHFLKQTSAFGACLVAPSGPVSTACCGMSGKGYVVSYVGLFMLAMKAALNRTPSDDMQFFRSTSLLLPPPCLNQT